MPSSDTVTGLDAYGASLTVDNGAVLAVSESSPGSGVGDLTLGDGTSAGSLSVAGGFSVQGVGSGGSITGGLEWVNGTISGGGTVTLDGRTISDIDPAASADNLVLNGTSLVNRGWLYADCSVANDATYSGTLIQGENAATLDNEGSMQFNLPGTSGPSYSCEFQQAGGGPSTLINNSNIMWNADDSVDAVDVGWQFESTDASQINNAMINLYGGQVEPISGHWNGASMNLLSGGAYSITSDLADFGSQNASQADVLVQSAPGTSGAASTAYTSFLAGTTAAASLTITAGEWTNGWITAHGPLTLGQTGGIMTISNLENTSWESITVNGIVNAASYNADDSTLNLGADAEFNVYGTTGLSGTETVSGGSGSSVDFEGNVDVSSEASITTPGGLVIGGAVSGTGNLTITAGGPFYEQGGVSTTGNLTVSAGGDVQLSGTISDLGDVSVTTPGSVDISASVDTTDLSVAGSNISIEGRIGEGGGDAPPVESVSLTSSGNIDMSGENGQINDDGPLTLSGGGVTTISSPWVGANDVIADGEVLNNEGVVSIWGELLAENGSQIINDGELQADGVPFNEATDGPASRFVNANDGQLIDWSNPSTPDDTISIPYGGGGSVSNAYIINDAGSGQYGGNNPAAPDMVAAACDQDADCGNGDWSTSETDFSVAGLGGPLALTRQYSSRLATAQSSPGMFGYGWITPFEQRLYLNSAGSSATATVQTATGSPAVFTLQTDGSYQAATGIYATLTANTDGTFTYVQPDQTTTLFNAAGLPVSVTNRQNQTTTYTYNGQGQLTQVTAPTTNGAGRSISFTYLPGTNLVETATDPAGLVMTYAYDSNDNLVSVTESSSPGGGSSLMAWKYYYDHDGGISGNDITDLHELTSLTNAGGNTTTISYEADYVTGVQQPGKGAEIWQYEVLGDPSDSTSGETIQTSPAGNVTTYTYNSQDEPTEIQYADGSTENMTYDSNWDLATKQDGNYGTTYYWYDSAGNLNHEKDPDGHQTYWSYDADRDLTWEELPSGETTSYNDYDSGGEPASITVAAPSGSSTPSQTTSMTYYPDEQLETKTTQDGGETQYTYDSYGDLATVTGPATSGFPSGTETTYGYDADGRQVCETTPRVTAADAVSCVNGEAAPANAQVDTYDALGDLMSSTTPDGGTTTYTYWPDQQIETVTAPNSNLSTNVTSYSYLPNGQLQSTTYGTGSSQTTQSETYDADDNLATQTNGDGKTYSYLYNNMDQLWKSTPPAGSSETTVYTYDGDGNVATITYPAVSGTSEETTYSYNGENQVTGVSYSDGETSVANTYEPDGQPANMSDASGDTTYLYDGLDRLTNVCVDATSIITSPSQCSTDSGRLVSYGYNGDNDQTSIGYPNGNTITQGFNAADQLTSVQDWLGNTTSFGYDADSDLLTTTYPTATSDSDNYTYNLDDALSGVTMKQSTSTLASISLTRYPDDLIETEAQTGLPGPASDTYTYTQQQELAADTPTGASASNYTYDGARNITELAGSSTYAYSSNGDSELTSSPAGTYGYNPLGERTGFTPTSGTASSYTYNADENLTQATVPAGTVDNRYNGGGQLMSSTNGSSTTAFTWDDTASTPRLLQAGSEAYIYGPNGEAIEQISSSGTVQYLHQDQIGSTRLITNSSGSTSETFTYTPYGSLQGSTGSASSLLGYAGQYTDPTTGLTYNQARWYDPGTGQFMVVDPKVETTWQPYAYADDNPITGTDPTGQSVGIVGSTLAGGCVSFFV